MRDKTKVVICTALMSFAFTAWIFMFFTVPTSRAQREAIAHHAAHYEADTGDFKWNDRP